MRRSYRNDNIGDEVYECEENRERLEGDMDHEMKRMKTRGMI